MRHSSLRFRNLDALNTVGIGSVHLIAIFAILPSMWSLSGFFLFVSLYFITGPVGITLCYHRLLTHGSFKTRRWFKYVLAVCGTLAWQGSVFVWTGTHRLHHKYADKDKDPHSPKHGFAWSHIFWTIFISLFR